MDICNKLKVLLKNAIDCDTILLGGLDSSILASISNDIIKNAITVAYYNAYDLPYAKSIANKYKLNHIIRHIDDNTALLYAREIIKIMHVFDPIEVRNDIVLYASMQEAKKHRIDHVITGDGSDELFAGYNYMLKFDYARLNEELERLYKIMHFSSLKIGEELDVKVSVPYLTDEIIKLARSMPIDLKVREYNGIRYGKWILRTCFKDMLGEEIVFRRKMAMEEGSGLSRLSLLFDDIINEQEFLRGIKMAENDGVKIKSKEHLYYYNIFREEFGVPKVLFRRCSFRCPDCLACIDMKAKFCRVCGAFPVTPMRTF
ncbi:MAG: hypothetical protein KatS3mg003_1205 [Candidatus Nitrosocaldaceae archaeon]|nr:MAG: hypothetical protein KatS3mg003_1205 [Candidatus Nitrosocaldaceae archaeon]